MQIRIAVRPWFLVVTVFVASCLTLGANSRGIASELNTADGPRHLEDYLLALIALRDGAIEPDDATLERVTQSIIENNKHHRKILQRQQAQQPCPGLQPSVSADVMLATWGEDVNPVEAARMLMLDGPSQAMRSRLDPQVRKCREVVYANRNVDITAAPFRVDLMLYSQEETARNPAFAAAELKGRILETVEPALQYLPDKFRLSNVTPELHYDLDSRHAVFQRQQKDAPGSLLPVAGIYAGVNTIRETIEKNPDLAWIYSGRHFYLPRSRAMGGKHAPRNPDGTLIVVSGTSTIVLWRGSLVQFVTRSGQSPATQIVLALDMPLALERFTVSPAVAESQFDSRLMMKGPISDIVVSNVRAPAPPFTVQQGQAAIPILLLTADVQDAAIVGKNDVRIAELGTIRELAETYARQQTALQPKPAQAEARAPTMTDAELRALLADCRAMESATEALACVNASCDEIIAANSDQRQVLTCKGAVSRANALARNEEQRKQKEAERQQRALASIYAVPRYADSPRDIVGLKIGMNYSYLSSKVGEHFQNRGVVVDYYVTQDTGLFQQGMMVRPRNGDSEMLAFYILPQTTAIGLLSRTLRFPSGAMQVQQVVDGLTNKYGSPSIRENGGERLIWVSAPGKEEACGKIADITLSKGWISLPEHDGYPKAIRMDRAAGEYSQFAECGDVMVADIEQHSDGTAASFSVVWFDPSMLREQEKPATLTF